MHLLLAEDDSDTAVLLRESVRRLWPDCTIATTPDGAATLRAFAAQPPDLVLLDVTVPPPDGLAICRAIRQANKSVPILVVTDRAHLLDEVRALDLGVDSYVTKPFDSPLLLARLRALARRAGLAPYADRTSVDSGLALGDLTIDFGRREVRQRGAPAALTPTEWVLLEFLACDAGQFVPHEAIVARVWGQRAADARHLGYLKVYINRLRSKLDDVGPHPRYIETRRGQGYRLAGSWPADASDRQSHSGHSAIDWASSRRAIQGASAPLPSER